MPSTKPTKAEVQAFVSRFDSMADDSILRVRHVAELLCCSPSTVWRARRDGTIPEPVRVTAGVVGWRVGDLRYALRRKAAA